MITMPPRHGKALALDTPIPTPTGWIAISELRPGDALFDEMGKVCHVKSISEIWKNRPVYKVTTDDGNSVIADAEHEWVVRLCRKRPVFKIKTTAYLANRSSNRAPLVAPHGIIDTPKVDLLIDPYVLGVWLGDGASSHATISAADEDAIIIRREIERRGYKTADRATKQSFGIFGLLTQLKQKGLIRNKHVPAEYLRASADQRRDLLKGLIDTDGYVAPDGQIEFCGVNLSLCESVRELVHSLGYKASLIEGRATLNGVDCGPKYRIMFYMPHAAHMPRKANKCREPIRKARYLTFEPCGIMDTICIEVDSPSHMFLCGKGMIPTHNSELASRRFPAYAVGKTPDIQIIAASYNSDLANDFGREVRNIVGSPEFTKVFKTTLAQDSKAANRWHTDKGGMYVAAGVGTAITGRGANILLIDDPFKDRQEADSEVTRQRVWDWYTSTAYTRLMPGGAIVVINTRWHDDDLSGRLLSEQEDGGDKWELLSLPAINKDGIPLWQEWYPLERLEQIRAVLPARDWNALYQQNPIPDEGDYFKAGWFGEYEELPPNLKYYGASDYAVTDQGGDFTEHGIIGVDGGGNMYVADWWRGQTTSDIWIEKKCDLIQKYAPFCWFGESGPIRRAVEPFMLRRMQEREAYCRIEWLASVSDKPTRARPIQALASMGKLYFPKNSIWKNDLMIQLLRFPAGKLDDGVDVLSLFGRGMEFIKSPKQKKNDKPIAKHYTHDHGWMA